MLTKAEITTRTQKVIADHLDLPEIEVVADAHFINNLGADSLDAVEIVMALEEEFDVEIPDDVAERMTTVNQAVEEIAKVTGAV